VAEEVEPRRHAEVTALYQRFAREVWAVAYARHLDRDLAMDAVHETFLRYWQQHDHGEAIEFPRAWLLRVARNLAEDQAKSAFRKHGTQAPETMTAPARQPQPWEVMAQNELFATVRSLLEELPPSDRDILTMRYALDYDAEKISAALDVPLSAIHMRLSRARQRLAEKLTTYGVNDRS
jgi:RNA polymerase sigma-70 factor, ECF subfamily